MRSAPRLVLCLLVAGCSSDSSLADGPATSEAAADLGHDATSDAPDAPDRVQTTGGPVQGTLGATSRAFLGIPYSAPPVGVLRFASPQPSTPWTQRLDTTRFGNICPQTSLGLPAPPGTQDEDCLTLNVWTPYPAPAKPAPVMIWIHGGGFVGGASAVATYDGTKLVQQQGVVVVSFNYRLGPLGWLAHPGLATPSGNFGLMDQQAALKWVKDNIGAFGGDPNRVTLFGESAGGISVCSHLASPASKGLFHRAILQSGPCTTTPTLAQAQAQGQQLAQAVTCDTATDVAGCLRGKSVAQILGALKLKPGLFFGQGASWSPNVDASLLPDQPLKLLKTGAFNKVPVLLGTNRDEGTLFVMAAGLTTMTQAQYENLVKLTFLILGDAVLAQYPASAYGSSAAALADLIGDMVFVCGTRSTAHALASNGAKTYLYQFTHVPAHLTVPFLGCHHGAEVPYVFNTPAATWGTGEDTLASAMRGYWTRMATAGDPNGSSAVSWPIHDKATDEHLTLDLTIASGSALKKARCDFWAALLP